MDTWGPLERSLFKEKCLTTFLALSNIYDCVILLVFHKTENLIFILVLMGIFLLSIISIHNVYWIIYTYIKTFPIRLAEYQNRVRNQQNQDPIV